MVNTEHVSSSWGQAGDCGPLTPWPADETGRLRSVVDNVAGMESALVSRDLAGGTTFADALVDVTTEFLDDLDLDPGTDPERDAELISTLRVYRNAAFVFRKLAGGSEEPDAVTQTVCAALIEQGHDHLRTLIDQRSECDQSPEHPDL